jgi:hypothetical protein
MRREIYKVEQRRMRRYSRVLYHQKGTRTHLSIHVSAMREGSIMENPQCDNISYEK